MAVAAHHVLEAELAHVPRDAGDAHALPQLWAVGELGHPVGPPLDGLRRVLLRADEALDAVLHHLGDSCDAGGHHGDTSRHALGQHHGRHLVEGREQDDVGPGVELVDLVRDIVELDAPVAVDRPLDLLHVLDLVVADPADADDDEPDVLAVARHGLEALDGEGLVLARAHDAHAQEGDRPVGHRLGSRQAGHGVHGRLEERVPPDVHVGRPNVDDLAVGGRVEIVLPLAHGHRRGADAQRLSDGLPR
mmetsp:Transcript_68484/g.179519  ORF Transcript_68484/g.179519 Transcript_68484/m.179519 type:complete len:248 (+) Transcript_68484:826-1569(+)